jgi:cytochrome c-type biogenesis protein CcmH
VTRLLLLALLAAPAWAKEAPPAAEDPALERRVVALAEELRCLVCQNQTLADSHAPLAIDLKNQIREQLQAGNSERQVTELMVQRYGDFVLYRPPVKGTTWLLWFGPFLLLGGGLAVLLRKLRRRAAATPALTESQHRRAAELLAADERGGQP